MCGIAGFISTTPQPANIVGRMTNLIRHRGPDDEGFALFHELSALPRVCGGLDTPDEAYNATIAYTPKEKLSSLGDYPVTLALGHRRLSIVDLSPLGHQPMCSLDGRYWIVFNGEVYNHIELRADLEKVGYQFVSHSDTEVIIAAYDHWGEACLSRFNGMWAFVLLDRKENKVFLARDRFGVKPLYWWCDGTVFLFASEIKAFRAYPKFSAQPNAVYLQGYLQSGPKEFLPETAFVGVHRLLHSHCVLATPQNLISGNFRTRQWWKLTPNLSNERFEPRKAKEYAEQYYELLKSAVSFRLRADVRVGSCLSGGLDSSSIVYLMNQLLGERGATDKQETFSSFYSTPGTEHCDESKFIHMVADSLGVMKNMIEPRPQDIPEAHKKFIWAMDTPPESTGMSSWPTYKLIHQCGIKVTLDGQGADEQMAGYLRYLTNWLHDMSWMNALKQAPRLFLKHSGKQVVRTYLACLAKALLPAGIIARSGTLTSLDMSLNEFLASDSMSNLITLIHYSDRESMAHSVESRMPFVDYRLAEMMAAIPSVYKIHNGWTKMPGRIAFEHKLPDKVVWRKDKMGWPIPEQEWFGGELKGWFEEHERKGVMFAREIGLTLPATDETMKKRIRLLNLSVWNDQFIINNK